MKKIKNIIVGWYRFIFRKKSQMAKDRLSICWPCDSRRGRFCGICWCELDAKAEIEDEKCDLNKW